MAPDIDNRHPEALPVDVPAIERELAELWRSAADAGEISGRRVVIRACLGNLVVWAPPGPEADRVRMLGSDVSLIIPMRVLRLEPDRSGAELRLEAWISANCHLAPGGGKEICSEEVSLAGGGSGVDDLPQVVFSLLATDVPTTLFIAGPLPSHPDEEPALAKIAAVCDRLVIDSQRATCADAPRRLSLFSASLARCGVVGDLAWRRDAGWRTAVVEEFDAELAGLAAFVSGVRVEVSLDAGERGLAPGLLLVGWIASRLGWRSAGRATLGRVEDAIHVSARFESETGAPRTASVVGRAAPPGGEPGIASLSMAIAPPRGAPPRTLRIQRVREEHGDIVLGIDSEGNIARVARFQLPFQAAILAHELRAAPVRPAFHDALAMTAAIAPEAGDAGAGPAGRAGSTR